MATTINAYSVSLGLDASSYIDSSKLSRKETAALVKDIEAARTPAEKFAQDHARLTKALNEGAISLETYNRLLESKRPKMEANVSLINPYTIGLTAVTTTLTAATAAGVQFVSFLREQQGLIDDAADAAQRLGISYSDMKSLEFGFKEGAGIDAKTVQDSVKKLQINLAKAVDGDEGLRGSFESLGLDATKLIGSGPKEAVLQISDAMAGVSNHSERLKLSMEIFGKSGADLASTLAGGRDALEESTGYAEKWLGLTDAQIAGVGANNDAWDRIALAVEGASTKLAAEFAPAMLLAADYITDLVGGVSSVDETMTMVVDTTVYFAGLLKDAFELVSVTHTTLANIASMNFTAVASGISEAVTFDSGQKALDALYERRKQLEEEASAKQLERIAQRGKMELATDEDAAKKKADAEARELERVAKEQDRINEDFAKKALKAAQDKFEQEKKQQDKLREDVAKGPGAGMEAGSADAARFMADQVNATLAAQAVPEQVTTEQQMMETAKQQLEILQAQDKKQTEQVDTLKKILEEQKQNGFKRIR